MPEVPKCEKGADAVDRIVKAQWTSTNRRTEPGVAERGGSACQAIPEKHPNRDVFETLVDMEALSARAA